MWIEVTGPIPPGLRLAIGKAQARRLGVAAPAVKPKRWWQLWRWL